MSAKIYSVDSLPERILLGRQTENGVRQIRIDCLPWLDQWPDLNLYIWVTPAGGAESYPADAVMDGDVLEWTISSADTAVAGDGTMEVVGLLDGIKTLSAIAMTYVTASTTAAPGTTPEAYQGWVDQVLAAGAEAAESAGLAAASEDKAAQYAAAAAESARQAEESNQGAQGAAGEAAGSAEAAERSAEEAAMSENNAAASAEAAAGSAAKAATSESNASASAEEAATSAGNASASAESAAASAEAAQTVLNSIPEDYKTTVEQVAKLAPAIMLDASGNMVTVADAAERNVAAVSSTIATVQSGAGNPSPDNIRPISGWDAVNLTRTGRNLVSHQDCKFTYGNKATVITDDYIDVTVPATYDYGNIPVRLKGGVAYTLYVICEVYGRDAAATNSTTIRIRFEKVNPYEQDIKATANGTYTKLQRYTPVTDVEENILLYANFGSPVPASVRMQVMLLEGDYALDTVPPFEPGVRQTLTAALPETVYGGTIDWTSGVLTVTHRRIELTGEEIWASNTSTNAGQFYAKRLLTGNESTTSTTNGFCTHYRYANGYAGKDNKIVQGHGVHVWIVDTDFATVDDLKAYFATQAAAGTPVTIVYPLATPYTIQLTPQQLDMLKGDNNVWSDSGDTSVTYIADTKLYIDGKFVELYNAILAQGANI